jgi:hypothetical protein
LWLDLGFVGDWQFLTVAKIGSFLFVIGDNLLWLNVIFVASF